MGAQKIVIISLIMALLFQISAANAEDRPFLNRRPAINELPSSGLLQMLPEFRSFVPSAINMPAWNYTGRDSSSATDRLRLPQAPTGLEKQKVSNEKDGRIEVLAEKVTDPTSLLNIIQICDYYSPSYFGQTGDANAIRFYPMLGIKKTKSFPFDQVCRPSIEFSKLPDGTIGVGDLQIFDNIILEKKKWGKWGIGPCCVIPTASNSRLGQGKWQAGPSGIIMYTRVPHWQFGLLAQNYFSFAGDPSRPEVNTLYLTPLIVCHLKKGWYLNSNAQSTYDWLGKNWTIPANIGVGKVFKIGEQSMNINLQGEWMVSHSQNTSAPQFTIKLNTGIIFE